MERGVVVVLEGQSGCGCYHCCHCNELKSFQMFHLLILACTFSVLVFLFLVVVFYSLKCSFSVDFLKWYFLSAIHNIFFLVLKKVF